MEEKGEINQQGIDAMEEMAERKFSR